MSAGSRQFRVSCGRCDWRCLCSIEELTARLRDAGMLRRAVEPEPELIVELFMSAAVGFTCDECGCTGLSVEQAAGDDDWPEATKCEVCKVVIPIERLEVFPAAKRCVNCEATGAEPDERDDADFCRYCGGLMNMKQTGGSGITRYRSVCSDCGRSK